MARIGSLVALCLLASVLGRAALLAPAQPHHDYEAQVAQLCRTTTVALDAYAGSAYHGLLNASEQKADVLRALRPPSLLRDVHRELLVREARVARISRRAMGVAAAAGSGAAAVQVLPRLRAELTALSVAYGSLGIRRCSTSAGGTAPARTIAQPPDAS